MRVYLRPLVALAFLASLASLTSALNYTCALEERACTYELKQDDYVFLYTGYNAQAFVQPEKVFLRFTDAYGNYMGSLELRSGQEDTSAGALAAVRVNSLRTIDTMTMANVTLRALRPNLKLVVDFKPIKQWPVVGQGALILLRDYVRNVTVVNDGETTIGTFRFSFLLEQGGEVVGYPIDRQGPRLSPGQVAIIPFEDVSWSTLALPKPLPAPFRIHLQIDRQNLIIETNKKDNEVFANVEVQASATPTPTSTPNPTLAPALTTTPTPTPVLATPTPTPAPTLAPEVSMPRIDGRLLFAIGAVIVLALAVWFFTRPKPPAEEPIRPRAARRAR